MPGNGPTLLNDIVVKRICDALKRGNTRSNACSLARIQVSTFSQWMRKGLEGHEDYIKFALQVRDAEAFAEDETIEVIKAGKPGWQGGAWWLQRRNRAKWGDIVPAVEKARIQANAANNTSLDEVPLADLEQAIQDAAEMKRAAIAASAKKTGTKE